MERVIALILEALFPRLCVHCREYGRLLCIPCAKTLGDFPQPKEHEWAWYWYAVPSVRKLIDALKFSGDRAALAPLTPRIREQRDALEAWWQEAPPLALVPVPITRRRLCERGCNQSAVIAQALACVMNVPVLEGISREGKDIHLARLQVSERAEAMKTQKFFVTKDLPKSIALIDDVITTGTTLKAMEEIAMASGVERVWKLTLARSH